MKSIKTISSTVLGFVLLTLVSSNVFAAVDLSLAPSTGIVTDDTAVDININTNGDTSAGIAFRLNVTGDMQYINNSDNGDYCASNFSVNNHITYIDIICLNSSSIAMNGTLGTVYFDATAPSSTSGLNISTSGLDLGGLDTGTLGTGTYTTGTVPTQSDNDAEPDLPETAIFDNTYIKILSGIFLLLLGILIPEIIIVNKKKEFKEFEEKVS